MKKLISIVLVVVLALSLGTVAMAAPKDDKTNNAGGKDKATEESVIEVITYTVEDEYDVVLNTGNSAKNSQATLEENGDFTIDVFANKGNPNGWTVDIDFSGEAEKTPVYVDVDVDLYKGNPKNGKYPVQSVTLTFDANTGEVVDSSPIANNANFLSITKVTAVYEEEVETESDENGNNGRSHGNNQNFGKNTNNGHKTEAAGDDGYSHPGGKDGESNGKNNGKVTEVAEVAN